MTIHTAAPMTREDLITVTLQARRARTTAIALAVRAGLRTLRRSFRHRPVAGSLRKTAHA